MSIAEQAPPTSPETTSTPEATATETPAVEPVVGDKPVEGDSLLATEAAPESEAKPEAVEFKLPEGWKAEESQLEAFRTTLVDPKLTPNERAQALVDLHVKTLQDAAARASAGEAAMIAAWQDETRKDPDIGGDKLGPAMADARLALQKVGVQDLTDMLLGNKERGIVPSWLGSYTPMVKFLARVGSLYKEGGFEGSGRPAPGDPLAKMYPSMYSQE